MTPAVAELVRERTEAVVAHTSEQCRPARTQSHVAVGTTARDFLAAVDLNTRALRVTAVISGERIENVEEEQTATIRRPSRPITMTMSGCDCVDLQFEGKFLALSTRPRRRLHRPDATVTGLDGPLETQST